MRQSVPGITFLGVGLVFGILITKGEVISWYRIQEMFRFQSVHMFGILISAILVAMAGLAIIRSRDLRSVDGTPISLPPKILGRGIRYVAGGILFGLGWSLTGACPGPLFALLGTGAGIIIVVIGFAVLGTLLYGWMRPWLPH